MNQKLLDKIFQLTHDGFYASAREYLPHTVYRDYSLWALSKENPYQKDYLQVLGLKQFAQLTLSLFEGLVEEDILEQLAKYSVPMNVYLAYENISDNLAIGLANRAADDTTYDLRRIALLSFNDAMCNRLTGLSDSAEKSLAPIEGTLQQISSFWQSHNPAKHKVIAHAYLNRNEGVSLEKLEYAVSPSLVVNIETCTHVAKSVANNSVGLLVLEGLVNRYQAVSTLIKEPLMSLQHRVDMGTNSILVIPTLAYYIGVLAETIQPIKNFQTIVEKGLLKEALTKAAMLVRLVNDLGMLATQTEQERAALFDKLLLIYRRKSHSVKTINEFVIQASEEVGSVFARIYKDAQLGEFNLCLGDAEIINAPSIEDGLFIFEQKLSLFSRLYAQTYAQMMELLDSMSNILGEKAPSAIIHRFVDFHEKLYVHPYNQSIGEYCV